MSTFGLGFDMSIDCLFLSSLDEFGWPRAISQIRQSVTAEKHLPHCTPMQCLQEKRSPIFYEITVFDCSRGRPWRYSVIPSTPDFPTEYQIRLNSNPAGLPVIAANWGPGFRARTIILTHMFKQIKQSRTPDARLTK